MIQIKHELTRKVLFEVDGVNLTYAKLAYANLVGANLADANLIGANFTYANLARANLTRANLTRANLTGANLTGANLTGANLTGANLTGANLTGAQLYDAKLYNARLTGAVLTGVILAGATWSENLILRGDIPVCVSGLRWPVWMLVEQKGGVWMQIGCELHSLENWRHFDDVQINSMERRALKWWRQYKKILISLGETLI